MINASSLGLGVLTQKPKHLWDQREQRASPTQVKSPHGRGSSEDWPEKPEAPAAPESH